MRSGPSKEASAAMVRAGRDIRTRVRRLFKGNADEAVAAVKELVAHPEILEAWATQVERADLPPFRFADFPPAIRPGAMEAIAVAYLAAGAEEGG